MNVPIQKDSFILILIGLIICVIVLLWTYRSDVKNREKNWDQNIYEKSLSWRVYIIGGVGFFLFLMELLKRLFT